MLTTRDAARLLAAAGHGAPLASLTDALGFGPAHPLPRRDHARTGIDLPGLRAAVAALDGPLRALLLDCDDGAPLRERIPAVARSVARRSAQLHWLVVARHRASGELLLTAPEAGARTALPALQVEPAALRESDAETFAALAAARDGQPAPLVHLRWRETLGREALTRRFYRELEAAILRLAASARGRAGAAERRTIALLAASRLLFLAFLETKGWLDGDRAFLRHQMERTAADGPLHVRLLEPLCFGTLNTPLAARARVARAFGRVPFLNGGLFQRTPVERRCRALRLDDDAIAAVIGELLPRYRLTARESSADLADAAVDPEMLGRAFESLMGDARRRAHGAFYTPQPIIARMVDGALEALGPAGPTALAAAASRDPNRPLRVLDPACGSGAFLVHALETLAARRRAQGDPRPVSAVRREVLTRSIFGVDVDPTAVWLCQLRLWLSVVVEDDRDDPMRLPPLPNLDRNVREGDALAGGGLDGTAVSVPAEPSDAGVLRLRYARASGARKRTLARALDASERRLAIARASGRLARLTAARRELLLAARSPDLFAARRGVGAAERRALEQLRRDQREARAALRRLRDGAALPFDFATHFAEVAGEGGFDLVLGNPPWVRPHAVPPAVRAALRDRFVVARQAAWGAGAEASGAGRGFASQADLAALFVERAVQLARPGGIVALLVPSKLWGALAGGGVRALLAEHAELLALEDWREGSAGFDAVVYPSALCVRRRGAAPRAGAASPARLTHLRIHTPAGTRDAACAAGTLPLDATPGAPWLLLPPEVRRAFDAIAAAGTPLAGSPFGRPLLGVKSGCNAAFIVERADAAGALSAEPPAGDGSEPVRSGPRLGRLAGALLRPLLRGEEVRHFARGDGAARAAILWTHDARGAPLAALPPDAQHWLAPWRHALERRSDGRGARWWALFRTEAARHDRARVVWSDIGRAPRALVLPAGDPTVPLNTCYVVRTPSEADAHALAALLNAPVIAAWLNAIAEPARGGYRRYLGWTCARLPLPRDWARARARLAPLGASAARSPGAAADAARACLDGPVLDAFGLDAATVAPLLAWDAEPR